MNTKDIEKIFTALKLIFPAEAKAIMKSLIDHVHLATD